MALQAGQAYVDLVPRLDPSFGARAGEMVENSMRPALDRVHKAFMDTGEKLRTAGRRMTLFITLPFVAGAFAATKYAVDVGEQRNKVNVVFGDMADAVLKWAKGTAESLGISERGALTAAGTFGNLFRALGLGQFEAAGMSLKLVGLASDLASFNNADPTEVLDALRAGLVGETEPLRKFGININEARLQAKALELGLWDGEGALASSAKAQAAYALMLEDTTLAQGDFARTSDGAANRQRILKARFEDLVTTIGEMVLPIFEKLLGYVESAVTWFSHLDGGTKKLILVALAGVAALGPLAYIIGSLATVIGALLTPVGLVVASMLLMIGAAVVVWLKWDQIWTWIKEHPAYAFLISLFAPGGAFILAFVLIVGALKWLYENWDAIWREIEATANEVATFFMTELLPVFLDVWHGIEEAAGFARDVYVAVWAAIVATITNAITLVETVVTTGMAIVTGIIQTTSAIVVGVFTTTWSMIQGIVTGAMTAVGFIISTTLALITGIWNAVWGSLAAIVSGAWAGITGAVSAGWSALSGVFNGFIGALRGAWAGFWGGLVGVVSGVYNGVVGAFRSIVDGIKGIWNGFARAWNNFRLHVDFPSVDLGPFGEIGGGSIDITLPNIPTLHQGGIVPGHYGEDVLAMVRAGEQVTRVEDVGSTGGLIINGDVYIDADNPKQLFEQLHEYELLHG